MTDDLDLDEILAGADDPLPDGHRSGMVALCGRPNVGKSTLLNRLVGEKVAIVTEVPGTTRNAIRGVLTLDGAQVVFLDTPGLAKPRTLLSKRLNALVRETWSGVDLVVFMVDAAGGIGAGDEYLAGELAGIGTPVVAVANKIDRLARKEELLPALAKLHELMGAHDAPTQQESPVDPGGGTGKETPPAGGHRGFVDVVPVSAETGENVERFLEVVISHLPEGPRLFPTGRVSDQPERQLAAEILREKLITRAREELPHSIAVTVEEVQPDPDRDDLLRIDAVIHVERDSQKGIVIGRGGQNLKAAGSAAREELEVLFGSRVHLTTHVKVAKEWQRDPKLLGRLGY